MRKKDPTFYTDEEIEKQAPDVDYRDSAFRLDHDHAFQLYFKYRNISKVHRETDIPKATLYNWKRKYNWDQRIQEIEERGRAKVDRSLEEAQTLHLNMYRFLQVRAFSEIREGQHTTCPNCKFVITECPNCGEELPKRLHFRNMGEVAKVLDTAIKGERLVTGLSTSNVDVRVIKNLSDEFSERLGIALGRLAKMDLINDFLISKIVHEFMLVLNEKPIMLNKLKSANIEEDKQIGNGKV